MTAAVVLLASSVLALVGVLGWVVHRHVSRVEARADEDRSAQQQLDDLADQRDAALGQAAQAAADLRAARTEQGIERATHERTARELQAALEVIRERTVAELVGAPDDDVADVVVRLLQARIDAIAARAEAAGVDRGPPPAGDAGV